MTMTARHNGHPARHNGHPARHNGHPARHAVPPARPATFWTVADSLAMTKRNLIQAIRMPALLYFAMMQPILFVLMFAYVFAQAIPLPGGGSYREYVVTGVFIQTVAFAGMTTGAGIADDLGSGLVDRFRSLPMSPSAVLFGRTLSDLVRNVLTAVFMAGIGLAVGWRTHAAWLSVLGGFAVLLLFAFALSWIGAAIGLMTPTGEAATSAGIALIFPLVWISTAFVPVQGMSSGVRGFAEWNPVTTVLVAIRELMGNPNPPGPHPDILPMRYPVAAAVFWSVLVLVVFVPLTSRMYRRKADR